MNQLYLAKVLVQFPEKVIIELQNSFSLINTKTKGRKKIQNKGRNTVKSLDKSKLCQVASH